MFQSGIPKLNAVSGKLNPYPPTVHVMYKGVFQQISKQRHRE